ncbi:MAG: class I SAM-dependent methyltransferase [Rhodospirillales bacterium]|nr:class I SAM-dependent methyltransferase [Rhodospirillales bacterium]
MATPMPKPPPRRSPAPRAEVLRLDAAFTDASGAPRFHLTLPPGLLADPGIQLLVRHERERGGYEYPTRRFLDAHLTAGDVFVDVGAHIGVFSLHVASLRRGCHVLAIEPHPTNVLQLLRCIAGNDLNEGIEVVASAVGATAGTAPLHFNSTMGHSLRGLGLPPGAPSLGALTVGVTTLDSLLAERPHLAGRRLILKIDVEGFEPEVIAGADRLLASGRVAAVIWEYGLAFRAGERRQAALALEASLRDRGFRLFRFPHPTMGGPLLPFAPTFACCNVFALAGSLAPLPLYDKPERRPEPLPPLERAPQDAATRAETTRLLMARRATDAARWADFEATAAGAEARAALVAPKIAAGARVLDLGAGAMALRRLLPTGCRYHPVDLLPFDAETIVVDFNQGQFPAGSYDIAVALDLVEFVHEPRAWLTRVGEAVPRLLVSYRPATGADETARREQGYFHDLRTDDWVALVGSAGFVVSEREMAGERLLLDCRRP